MFQMLKFGSYSGSPTPIAYHYIDTIYVSLVRFISSHQNGSYANLNVFCYTFFFFIINVFIEFIVSYLLTNRLIDKTIIVLNIIITIA